MLYFHGKWVHSVSASACFERWSGNVFLKKKAVFYDDDRSDDGRSFSPSHHLHWHIVPVYYPWYKLTIEESHATPTLFWCSFGTLRVKKKGQDRRELWPLFRVKFENREKWENHNLIALPRPLEFILSMDSVVTDTDHNDYFTVTMILMMTMEVMLTVPMIKCGELTIYQASG